MNRYMTICSKLASFGVLILAMTDITRGGELHVAKGASKEAAIDAANSAANASAKKKSTGWKPARVESAIQNADGSWTAQADSATEKGSLARGGYLPPTDSLPKTSPAPEKPPEKEDTFNPVLGRLSTQEIKYGALAIDKSNGAYYGWAIDHPSVTAAEERALAECKKAGGNGKVVLLWQGAGCAAYAAVGEKDGTAYGWGVARSRSEATAIANRVLLVRSKGIPAGIHVWGCNSEDAGEMKVLFDDAQTGPVAVAAWGSNSFGQLGGGAGPPQKVPVVVKGLNGDISDVAAGVVAGMAIEGGAVKFWGEDIAKAPTLIEGLGSGVSAIASGGRSNLAIHNGAVFAWGVNKYGQLGDGSVEDRPVPVAVKGMNSGVTAVAAGSTMSTCHCLAIRAGAVYSWGSRWQGSMGDGTDSPEGVTPQATPVAVKGLNKGVSAIAVGGGFNLAIKDGGVYGWGHNHHGQVGALPNAYPAKQTEPKLIPVLNGGVTAIAAGTSHSLAIKNGRVYAWGWGSYGALGTASNEARHTPEAVEGVSDAIAIAAGDQSSYALTSDGVLWAWGSNKDGQLGTGSSTNSSTPVRVAPPVGFRFASVSTTSMASHVVATLVADSAPVSRRSQDPSVSPPVEEPPAGAAR